jgi:hypothetical protein
MGVKVMNGSGSGIGNANIDVQGLEVVELGDPSHEAENGEAAVVACDRELAKGGKLLEILQRSHIEVPSGDWEVKRQLLDRDGVERI